MRFSTLTYGIDTSVFVRLLTGHPEVDFLETADALKRLHDKRPTSVFVVSNQVIGEAYVVLQHFYKLPKDDAKVEIAKLLAGGNFFPTNGDSVLEILKTQSSSGLLDRLIAQSYQQLGITTLTNDKRMAKLEGVQLLSQTAL